MNLVDLLRTAIGNTFRSKLRTTLTVIAIFIGAFTITLTSAIGTGVSSYIDTQVASIGTTDSLTVTKAATTSSSDDGPAKYDPSESGQTSQRGPASVSYLSPTDISAIRRTTGIASVQPAVALSPKWLEYGDHGKYVVGIAGDADAIHADLAAGRQLSSTSSERQLLLPTNDLKALGLGSARNAVGTTVTIGIDDYLGQEHQVRATVVGVQNESLFGGGAGANAALTEALRTAQETAKPTAVSTGYASATATVASGADVAKVKSRLSAAGYTGQTIADQLGQFETVINGIVGVLNAFAVIALIAAGFGIINTLLMSVQERTREIGLMKAMGMGGGRVYTLFSLEAVFIGFLGSAIGAGVAILLGTGISNLLARTVLKDLPGLHLLQFAPGSVATIIIVVMLIAFLAGTLPARRAARQNPIEALRYE
ncbi:ABC transporter permease [Curtobacterium sp. MCBD17_034]|uniref:ABC transporter permease n=1 Tax=unclassified Curtobacterium TaxID=257496 RepID=UPI000DAAA4E6|nr:MULTISPECIES: ABC transporter permease [unclassified Curtobacterium]PZF55486.1 ABC transporter permease [Curtobacterium sp. MCBD17_034]PZF58129.1 ABC transporter permease [Curtobacterium sp. MCBD17_013]PZM34745.1 ABC transporter permease [Curtobacterium sp. MCBD17_031]WIB67332.1 ABC transporter permease [Curtobacterium sp. MCBD17_035]WIE54522.1 ABC transporter permease [Curtobacterium sp. MCBD17_003]